MRRATPPVPIEQRAIAIAIVNLKARCGRAGLFVTMQAMEIPQKTVGWEIAGQRLGKVSTKKPRKGRRTV